MAAAEYKPTYIEDKPFFFVSYSSRDKEKVLEIVEQLEKRNCFNLWMDTELKSGDWRTDIESTIFMTECKGIFFFASENSMRSAEVFQELAYADKKDKIILPVNFAGDFSEKTAEDIKDFIYERKNKLKLLKTQYKKKGDTANTIEELNSLMSEFCEHEKYGNDYKERIEKYLKRLKNFDNKNISETGIDNVFYGFEKILTDIASAVAHIQRIIIRANQAVRKSGEDIVSFCDRITAMADDKSAQCNIPFSISENLDKAVVSEPKTEIYTEMSASAPAIALEPAPASVSAPVQAETAKEFCMNCGTEYSPEKDVFCISCGTPLNQQQPSVPKTQLHALFLEKSEKLTSHVTSRVTNIGASLFGKLENLVAPAPVQTREQAQNELAKESADK